MNNKFYKQKGFLITLITTLLIISIALITEHKKEFFVHENGNIKVFGSIGITLAIGLLLKWRFVREILGFLVLISIIGFIFINIISSNHDFLVANIILILGLIIVFYLLIISKSVKNYMNNKNN